MAPRAAHHDAPHPPPLRFAGFTFLNGGSFSSNHVPAHRRFVLEVTVLYAFAYIVLALLLLLVTCKLAERQRLHKTVHLLTASIIMQAIGILLSLLEAQSLAQRGAQSLGMRTAANLLFVAADVTSLTLLMLLAAGWTVVLRKLRARTRAWLSALLSVYIIAQITMVLWAGECARRPDRRPPAPPRCSPARARLPGRVRH